LVELARCPSRPEERRGSLSGSARPASLELALIEVKGRVLAPVRLLRPGGQILVLVIQVRAGVEIVRSGLGHHVDEPGSRTAELGVGPSATTPPLNRVRLKVKAGRSASALLSEEGLLKSAPSTEDVVLDPLLAVDRSSSPSRPCTIVNPGVSGEIESCARYSEV
jgi:hypothetical protein